MSESKERILFLCTGNACRSQMAEGFARAMHGDQYEVQSAGTSPRGMNAHAIEVMAESGVDISEQWSKSMDELPGEFDFVITVCDSAREACPTFPGKAAIFHVGIDDPPKLAANAETDEEAMQCYRRVRDEIRTFIERLPERLASETQSRKGSTEDHP